MNAESDNGSFMLPDEATAGGLVEQDFRTVDVGRGRQGSGRVLGLVHRQNMVLRCIRRAEFDS